MPTFLYQTHMQCIIPLNNDLTKLSVTKGSKINSTYYIPHYAIAQCTAYTHELLNSLISPLH